MKEKILRLAMVTAQCVMVWLGALLLASLGAALRTQGQSMVQHSPTPTPTPKVAGHPPSPPRPTPRIAGRPTPTPTPRPIVGHVVQTRLTASRSASASCPMQENFNGAITTNGATQVTYTWTSSDNSTWPQSTLHFASAGTKAVRETWTLGAAGQTVNGWVRLKVLSPNAYMSNQAPFHFRCP